ncbi:MAG: DUF362 domain-containing protein [Candidatus Aminicenantes bacterium]|nr:DUF362 domain-containing protein [Candidatus Aminicenantes bacterium]
MAAPKQKVILRRCSDYNPEKISGIIREGIEAFGLSPRIGGKITIKPNVVFAHHKIAPSAFTRPEFLDGLVTALKARAAGELRISVAEKCGAAIPTVRMFRRAGYYPLRRKHGLRLVPMEEVKKVKVPLAQGQLHTEVTLAREMVDRDFLVYAPKLKTNVLAHGLTGAFKLNMGILCDRERMWCHHYDLDKKIVDLAEVGRPDFIATDAVECAIGGNQLTERGRHLGAVIMATNPLAHDVVCAHILHLDPAKIGHLKLASERGYGSLDLASIAIEGDISLDELRDRTKDWDLGFIHASKLPGNMKVLCGEPYCTGGCHGVFLDWIYMIKDRKPKLWNNLPAWTVVIGEYKGDIEAKRVFLLGTCTKVLGKLKARRKIRIRGCPPKHKTIVMWLFLKAGIVNPMFQPGLILDGYPFYWLSKLRTFFRERF